MEVGGSNVIFKCWIFKKGLRTTLCLVKKLGLKGIWSMNDLLTQTQLYMNYKEKLLAKDIERNKRSWNLRNGRQRDIKFSEEGDRDMQKGSFIRFSLYILLNTLRDYIL